MAIMEWYDNKVQGWRKDKIMRLFLEMRNLSTKEHTPETLTFSVSKGGFDPSNAIVEYTPEGNIRLKIPIKSDQKAQKGTQLKKSVVFFYKVPHWFDENPDVMFLCRRYLRELEAFVVEAERMKNERE